MRRGLNARTGTEAQATDGRIKDLAGWSFPANQGPASQDGPGRCLLAVCAAGAAHHHGGEEAIDGDSLMRGIVFIGASSDGRHYLTVKNDESVSV